MRYEGLLLMYLRPAPTTRRYSTVHARSGHVSYNVGFFEDAFFSASSSGGGKTCHGCFWVSSQTRIMFPDEGRALRTNFYFGKGFSMIRREEASAGDLLLILTA